MRHNRVARKTAGLLTNYYMLDCLGFRFRLQVDQMGSRGTFEKARFILIKRSHNVFIPMIQLPSVKHYKPIA